MSRSYQEFAASHLVPLHDGGAVLGRPERRFLELHVIENLVPVGAPVNAASATAQIGSGVDGTVTITVVATGPGGNAYRVSVVQATGPNVPLSAVLVGVALTVTLPTDGDGLPDPAGSTALLVAAAIDALSQFSAVASGDGSGVVGETVSPVAFTGGVDPTAGQAGAVRADASFLYVATAANTWKKVALVAL